MAGTVSTTSGPTAVSGLASGIDSAAIVDALIKADRASTAVLETRKATFQTRLDAVRSFNTKLLNYQLDVAAINRPALYVGRAATSSNTAALTATATSSASPGSYQFNVTSIARASQKATVPQLSASTPLGAGTVSLQLGSGGTTVLNIASGNSSLTGIAQAINSAGLGVNASVLNDGTGARLLMTSASTGTANAITATGGGALASLFTGMSTLQTASDASISLGSGAGAVTITQSTNTFQDVVQGLTLTAVSTGASTVTVGNDSTGALAAVKQVVTDYNDLVQFMKDNASYNPTSKTAGTLFAEGSVRGGFNSITQSLLSSVAGAPAGFATLTTVGVAINQATGKLTLDEGAFNTAMSANPDAVSKLFGNSGVSSDPGVQFGLLGPKTKVTGPFTIAVTSPASQPVLSGGTLATTTHIDGTNNVLGLNVNGTVYKVTMTAGDYTGAQLATQLQGLFDQQITAVADKVKVGFDGNGLAFTGPTFGLAGNIQVDPTSTAQTDLQLPTNKVYGQDVIGTINGLPAVGSGQILAGAVGTDAEGLRLVITANAPIASATLTVSKGIAQLTGEKVKLLTDGTNGAMIQTQDALNNSIDGLTKSITSADARLADRRQRYQKQFLAMEQSINKSNSLSTYMQGQIKSWSGSSSGN